MKTYIVTLAAAIVTAGAAHAASVTVTMNAIDANGVGKEIGTLLLSDTQAGLQVRPALVGMSPIGTKRTCCSHLATSAFGGKADIVPVLPNVC